MVRQAYFSSSDKDIMARQATQSRHPISSQYSFGSDKAWIIDSVESCDIYKALYMLELGLLLNARNIVYD